MSRLEVKTPGQAQAVVEQLYRNMALIPLTEELEVVSKQDGDTIFFIGG